MSRLKIVKENIEQKLPVEKNIYCHYKTTTVTNK